MAMSQPEPSQEELRAAYEAELKRITVADFVLQTAASVINIAGRRLGVTPATSDERDLDQVRDAIDAVRGLLPVLEARAVPEARAVRDALTQLQMAYLHEAGATNGTAAAAPGQRSSAEPDASPEGERQPASDPAAGGADAGKRPGPAQASGRLWVPGS